ncbi:MAG: hypothetical protein DRR06_12905, partial [Gammaproteobacteria bacterium]
MPSLQELIDSGDVPMVGNPVTQQPQRQQQEPEDPTAFFQSGPGGATNDPMYREDRKAWYKDFTKGYYEQGFNNVNDYVEFVKSLGTDDNIDGYVKQQALKHMPPKIKREYAQLQEQKKIEAEELKRKKKLDEWNADPNNPQMK